VSELITTFIKKRVWNMIELYLKNWFEVFIMSIGLVTLIFISLVLLGYKSNKSLNKTEMRRAIAGAFVVGIHCLLFLSVVFNVERNVVIGAYLSCVSSIIGFYFGSRTAERKFDVPEKFERGKGEMGSEK